MRAEGLKEIWTYIQAAEHCGTAHSYFPHSRPMLGYREEARILDIEEVVGSGGPGLPREAGGVGEGGYRGRDGEEFGDMDEGGDKSEGIM